MGPRSTLGGPLVRAPVAGSDPGSRAPARPRRRPRAALPARAAGRAALDGSGAHRAHAGREPGRIRPARHRARRGRSRSPSRSSASRRGRAGGCGRRRDCGRAAHAASLSGRHPGLPRGRGRSGGRVLHRPARADVAARTRARPARRAGRLPGGRGCDLRDSDRARSRHRAPAPPRPPARAARRGAAALAPAAPRAGGGRARGGLERVPPGECLGEQHGRPLCEPASVARFRVLSADAPAHGIPRGGGGHGRPLAGALSRPGGHSAGARLVPAGRPSRGRTPLPPLHRSRVRRLAAPPRRRVRRPDRRASGPHLATRGEARPERPRRAEEGLREPRRLDLRGASAAADRHGAGTADGARAP